MATVVSQPERLVILDRVTWDTYERLIAEHGERGGTRFTYDEGVLQIMVGSSSHEERNRTLALLVEVIAEEMEIDLRRLGSMTCKREDLQKGFEPDSCFYIQNADVVSGKEKIDLRFDPPPDLTIEVDVTSDSLNRLPIFAAVGIPEVWRLDGTSMTIYRLEAGRYLETPNSRAFPAITAEIATQFLDESKKLKSTAWLRQVRAWARAQKT